MRRTLFKTAGAVGALAFVVAFTPVVSGCSKTKDPTTADITGASAPKLDPNVVRARMAAGMAKMNAAGGPKPINPNH